jgi:hypothetical protein
MKKFLTTRNILISLVLLVWLGYSIAYRQTTASEVTSTLTIAIP